MTALIKKDLYLAWKQAWMMVLFALLLCSIPSMEYFGTAYCSVLSLTVPLTTFACDERCHWDRYMAMTPCPAKRIVLSKYVFSLLLLLACLFLTFSITFLKARLQGSSYDVVENLVSRLSVLAIFQLTNAVSLPLVYRFGSEKGRLSMVLMCFAIFGIIMGGTALLGAETMFGWLERIPLPVLGLGAAALVLASNAASFFLSVHFYVNRQSGVYG